MSQEGEYDTGEDVLEEEDICNYTGEQCIGDKMFCEECPVFKDDLDKKEKNICLHLIEKLNENGLAFCQYHQAHVSLNFCRGNKCMYKNAVNETEEKK